MPFKIVRNDIIKMKVDAIVNTANAAPIYSLGVDTAVYYAAGEEKLLAERQKIGHIDTGKAAITPGFALPAKYIIHAVSPMYDKDNPKVEKLLRSCYIESFKLAKKHGCESIAFPVIATGSYGYPMEEGMRIALDEINAFLMRHDMLVYLVVFGTNSTRLGLNLYPELEAYIDHNYVCEKRLEEYGVPNAYTGPTEGMSGFTQYKKERDELERTLRNRMPGILPGVSVMSELSGKGNTPFDSGKAYRSLEFSEDKSGLADLTDYEEKESALEERMKHLSDTFQEYLFYIIKQKNLSNAEVYRNSIVTKQTFSKIKRNKDYHPDKFTAMRLCVGLRLNLDESKDLLARAGYALSSCDKRDVIFSFFIEEEIYDMYEIDIALESYGLPCLIS